MFASIQDPQDYISSFSFDYRLVHYDIEGSIVHVEMLSRQKIVSTAVANQIIEGLRCIQRDIKNGWSLPCAEDIHFAVEAELVRRIGQVGKAMHTARSRNDQVVLDLKLYIRDHLKQLLDWIQTLQEKITCCAITNQNAIMPGFTHLQNAQPILFSHHILAYAWMLVRDTSRINNTLSIMDTCPLGACAMSGTSFDIDRFFSAQKLHFFSVSQNSIDTVSDRDFILDVVYSCSVLMVHLSRMAEDFIIWMSSGFGYIDISVNLTSGSSIMPQKRNPDTLELIRAKSSITIGNLMKLLTLLKGQPLSYNRDLQEDKPPLFESLDTVFASLSISINVFESLKVNDDVMYTACHKGYVMATELADYLVRKGVYFREAHALIKQLVQDIRKDHINQENMKLIPLEKYKEYSTLFEKDIYDILEPSSSIRKKISYAGTGFQSVKEQIRELKSILGIS